MNSKALSHTACLLLTALALALEAGSGAPGCKRSVQTGTACIACVGSGSCLPCFSGECAGTAVVCTPGFSCAPSYPTGYFLYTELEVVCWKEYQCVPKGGEMSCSQSVPCVQGDFVGQSSNTGIIQLCDPATPC